MLVPGEDVYLTASRSMQIPPGYQLNETCPSCRQNTKLQWFLARSQCHRWLQDMMDLLVSARMHT